eukprot:gene23078-biopygen970
MPDNLRGQMQAHDRLDADKGVDRGSTMQRAEFLLGDFSHGEKIRPVCLMPRKEETMILYDGSTIAGGSKYLLPHYSIRNMGVVLGAQPHDERGGAGVRGSKLQQPSINSVTKKPSRGDLERLSGITKMAWR